MAGIATLDQEQVVALYAQEKACSGGQQVIILSTATFGPFLMQDVLKFSPADQVEHVCRVNGQLRVVFKSGGSVRFVPARNDPDPRDFVADVVISVL